MTAADAGMTVAQPVRWGGTRLHEMETVYGRDRREVMAAAANLMASTGGWTPGAWASVLVFPFEGRWAATVTVVSRAFAAVAAMQAGVPALPGSRTTDVAGEAAS